MSIDLLYNLCVSHNWFTAGTSEQYVKMFEYCQTKLEDETLSKKRLLDDLSLIIWLCTPGQTRTYIRNVLKKEYTD